jgi:hypothetical protein
LERKTALIEAIGNVLFSSSLTIINSWFYYRENQSRNFPFMSIKDLKKRLNQNGFVNLRAVILNRVAAEGPTPKNIFGFFYIYEP